MPLTNYASQVLRAAVASTDGSGQDAGVTLPEAVSSIFLTVIKTVEANADNLLTVRLQAYLSADAVWVDLPYAYMQRTATVSNANDVPTSTTRTPNIMDEDDSNPTLIRVAYFDRLPSNTLRTVWIVSGTTASVTWSAQANFELYDSV